MKIRSGVLTQFLALQQDTAGISIEHADTSVCGGGNWLILTKRATPQPVLPWHLRHNLGVVAIKIGFRPNEELNKADFKWFILSFGKVKE